MRDYKPPKIIQIMPCTTPAFVCYASGEEGGISLWSERIHGWALVEDGEYSSCRYVRPLMGQECTWDVTLHVEEIMSCEMGITSQPIEEYLAEWRDPYEALKRAGIRDPSALDKHYEESRKLALAKDKR